MSAYRVWVYADSDSSLAGGCISEYIFLLSLVSFGSQDSDGYFSRDGM
jgi:hypothetical protein